MVVWMVGDELLRQSVPRVLPGLRPGMFTAHPQVPSGTIECSTLHAET